MTSLFQIVRRGRPVTCAVVFAVALAAGCASAPAIRYYALAPVAPAAASASGYAGPPIEVRGVQIPPAMDRLELIRQRGAGGVEVSDLDHWAAPLDRLVRQALTEDLQARLPKEKVVIPGAAWPATRAVLSIDVLSFSDSGGTASMVLSWALRPPPGANGEALPPIGATLRVECPSSGELATTSRSWSELLGKVADRITAELGR